MMDPVNLLLTVLIILLAAGLGGIGMLIYQSGKTGSNVETNSKKAQNASTQKKMEYPKEDVQKFMEFDKIEDDMIIQDRGNRFVMAIKCQGINYDLMSETEMLAVEEGFSNFLNTLKYPIQLYVQARSLNLEDSINSYKDRIDALREDYVKMENQNSIAKRSGNMTNRQREQLDFELRKKRVLLEYGADIVNYVEKMSMNRNILQRNYYIVVSYHTSELGLATSFTKEEAHDLAYSELYTRCRSIAGALAPCGVQTSIMNSMELAEMLYVAYNRDDSDVYNIRRALDNGFYRLYSTAQDVLEKKQMAIDTQVREQAIADAEKALQEAMNKLKDKNGLTYEEQQEDSAKAQAMQLIIDNSDQFEQEVVDDALINLNSQMHMPILDEDEVEDLYQSDEKETKNDEMNAIGLDEKETSDDKKTRGQEESNSITSNIEDIISGISNGKIPDDESLV
ncbi:MAG: hypothetical protein IJ220_05410 [Clostridia bacterium]|nr:hypothetical protein [Clostridia bacterium]